MRRLPVALVAVIVGMIVVSPAIAQAFNYTFGGANDASSVRLLAAFGSLDLTCGNQMTDFKAKLTLDASTLPPTITLIEVGKGPFSNGPVTHIDWVRSMRPNEFGRAVSILALWTVKFRWGNNNAGDGTLFLDLPGPSVNPPDASLTLNGGGKTWVYWCIPIMAVYQCVPGAPGCN